MFACVEYFLRSNWNTIDVVVDDVVVDVDEVDVDDVVVVDVINASMGLIDTCVFSVVEVVDVEVVDVVVGAPATESQGSGLPSPGRGKTQPETNSKNIKAHAARILKK